MNTTRELARYHYEEWYQNGKHINSNNPEYNSTVSTKQNGELQFSIEISNVSADDLGDYVGIISADVYDLTSQCGEYRYSFIPHIYYRLPAAISYSSIEVYSKCMNAM